jgi:diguanylate cyclase (GGDEF)-like protein/PAS domain S-box-containing protein
MPLAEDPPSIESAKGPWGRFRVRYLFDYPPVAARIWAGIVYAGVVSLLGAIFWLVLHQPPQGIWPILVGIGMVAVAASFPITVPGTKFAVAVADIFIFTILATQGPAAAILAAGTESLVATLRASKRLSSYLSAPSAPMAAMAISGGAFSLAEGGLVSAGLGTDASVLLALCLAALSQTLFVTGPAFAMMAAKRGQNLRFSDWLQGASGVGAISLASALIAGLLYINAARFGMAVLVISAAVVLGLVLLLRITTQRQEAERQAQEALLREAQREAELSQQRFMAAFTHAAIGMALVKTDDQSILQVNQALCMLLGREQPTLLGEVFSSVLQPGDEELLRQRTGTLAARPGEDFSMELRAKGPQGREIWVALHCSQYEDPGGHGHCLIYQLYDTTSRHVAERQLHHAAHHDGLTDLANRTHFHQRLAAAVERSRTDAQQRFAVLFLDLDRFKVVNDSLGHLAGNSLLRDVAQRLCTCVRPGDLVARLGGDEFAILLEHLPDLETGSRLAQRMLDALNRPMMVNGTEVVPSASVGMTFSDLGYRTVDEVLRDADLAMYEAKSRGRGCVVDFDGSMHEKVAQKLGMESDLRRAISEGQLSLNFQPLYELDPCRLSGFEALVRWTHPERGPMNPAVFVALAEESGQIASLTEWVLDQALAHLAVWRVALPGLPPLDLHVNISGRDLARGTELVTHVERLMARHGTLPGALTLEITETTVMSHLDLALQTMGSLRQSGVRFSIDDFGTGYSSLAYLSTLPIDSLKIDRSFVMGLQDRPQNVEIVRAVLNLALSLGRSVIAEGIETAEQLDTLRRLGVHKGQGYLLSKPLRADQAQELLSLQLLSDRAGEAVCAEGQTAPRDVNELAPR